MKINDKSLIAYAMSSKGVEHSGYLNKKGEVNHSYKKRWFALKGNLLFYFEYPHKNLLGMIVLENCSIEVSDLDRYAFSVKYQCDSLACGARTYVLCAESECEMERWMKIMTCSSYTFKAMVVSEFEKTLAEVKGSNHRETNLDFVDSTYQTSVADTNKHHSAHVPTTRTTSKQRFKSLDTMRRSKSSENINRIIQTAKSPMTRRKSKNQTTKRQNYVIKDGDNGNVAVEQDKSTFEVLHTSFGAAIWTKIGETL